MYLSEIIQQMQEAYRMNGEMKVEICVNAHIYPDVEMNATGDTFYLEGYEKEN